MVDQVKTYTTLDDFLFSDWNTEMANIYAALNGGLTTTIANGSITEIKLADGANPAVYFAELFNDEAVVSGFTYVSDTALDVTILGGTAYILQTSTTPNKLIRVIIATTQTFTVTDNATNHLDLGSDGVIDVTQTSSAATDHTRLLKVIALAGSITPTPTDEADRSFLGNIGNTGDVFALEGDVKSVTEVTIDSGLRVRDSTNLFNITTTADITVDIEASVGLNGLDQGTEAGDTFYAVVLVAASAGGLPEGLLLVTEANFPASIVLPTGYDIFRRVMWTRNDSGSDLLLGRQQKNNFSYDDEQSVSAGIASANFADIATSSFVPLGTVMCHMNVDSGDTASMSTERIVHYTRGGVTGSSGGVEVIHTRSGSEAQDAARQQSHFSNVPVGTTSSRNVAMRGTSAQISVNGYEDTLIS